MTPEEREAEIARKRVANMTADQVEAQNAAHRVENMTAAQIQAHQAANRVENMTAARIQDHQAANRTENMSQEAIAAQNTRAARARAQRAVVCCIRTGSVLYIHTVGVRPTDATRRGPRGTPTTTSRARR